MLRPADSLPAVPICPGKSPSTGHFCCPSCVPRALIAHAPRRTALTSAEMLPARESGSGRPAGQWNTAGLWNATGAWNTLGAWNIVVRTRGVFTHRDDFQKPACVERGLVRTAMFHASAEVPRVGGGPTRRQCSTDGAPLYRRKLSSYCSCRQMFHGQIRRRGL